jgi:DNA (cytosine-5)-methyltransferase 1
MITVVDLFAGAGGSSLGATLAGCKVVWAGNHWPTAVAVHTANFPGAEHVCQDLRQFNFASLPDHDLLSASPACQGHAKARGKDRGHVHDESRATAWAVIDALEAKRPRWFVVENVPEFLDWSLYPSWLDAVHRLGYKVSPEILNAADYGVPQTRTRLYLRGQRRTVPRPMPLSLHARELVPASRILDMNKGKFRSVVGRVQKTQDWIKRRCDSLACDRSSWFPAMRAIFCWSREGSCSVTPS